MSWLGVFLAMAAVDAVWALYIRATAGKNAVAAAGFSGIIVLIGGLTTLAYVHDPRYIIPAALGGVVGTFLTVKCG